MSEDSARSVAVDEDGIAVRKSFVTDEFQVPAVSFRLHSRRDEPVTVRMTDTIPESFPMERIGFHPDHGSEDWTAYDDNRVEFEREVAPDEEVRTVYGIRADDPDPAGFLSTPAVGTAARGAELETVIGEDDGDAVSEVLSGDRESLPGMSSGEASDDPDRRTEGDADAGGADDPAAPEPRVLSADTEPAVTESDDGHSLDLPPEGGPEAAGGPAGDGEAAGAGPDSDSDPDPALDLDLELPDPDDDPGNADAADPDEERSNGQDEPDSPDGSAGSADTASDADGPDTGEPPADGLAAALASELRAGEVADEDAETLRTALGAAEDGDSDGDEAGDSDDAGVPESVAVRIDHLGSRVEEVSAYADGLAEFIDENGTAKELLDDLDEGMTTLRGELRDLKARADGAADERDAIAADVERALGDVDHLEERTADVEATVDELESGLSAARRRIDDLDAAVETVTDEAAALDERLDAADGDVTDVERRVGAVETELSESVEDLEAELSDVHDHLAELDEFRERLNDVFGD